MHACVLGCVCVIKCVGVCACVVQGEKNKSNAGTVPPGALKAVLRGHHFLLRTLGSPLADLSLRSVIGTAQAAGCEALCSPSPPPPIPQLQPSPGCQASPGGSRQQTRSREMNEVQQALGSGAEGIMVASL